MKLPLQLAASILLTSVYASGWPYHEIVGVGQSAAPVFVAPVYGVAPAVSLIAAGPLKEAATVVAGPVTGTTIVEGSSSGPVTVVSPGSPAKTLHDTLPRIEKPADAPNEASDDSVLIKGATAGPVTLVAPSDNSVPDADNAPSARAETKNGAVATSAEAGVSIKDAEESSAADASANATAISETIGVASARAVIGPSTGPIIIVGPTAPPIPIVPMTVDASTAAPATVATSTTSDDVSSTAAANASASNAITIGGPRKGLALVTNATEASVVEGSASSSASATRNSGNSVVSASARVNLITPPARIAAVGAPLRNAVVSAQAVAAALVSEPSGSVSGVAAPALLLSAPR
ncbi:uncharacterized protein LOC143371214 [Andrena cerasifolii]|uniref:uncharacterized protein LOC143371214 n=1 Tax=Andrena cerasifolii TaxID=2819439 RepID=UPI004037D7FA